ncbi:MAG: S8 family serine peptidase, partial [Lachnospiraceae bacterium]|nr:S8 family serine peptidase [Lachnospiraceae bacterium]
MKKTVLSKIAIVIAFTLVWQVPYNTFNLKSIAKASGDKNVINKIETGTNNVINKNAIAVNKTQDKVKADPNSLKKGTYLPNQVIVSFNTNTIKDTDISLKKARKMERISKNFGRTHIATGEKKVAARDAKSEVNIIKNSLGDNFVIEDTITFDDDLTVALVSSDKYSTKSMMKKLNKNSKIKSVDANSYVKKSSYEYSSNDPLNKYLYNINSPDATNTNGDNVGRLVLDSTDSSSVNAGYAWNKQENGSVNSEEAVIALIDTGVNVNHEELKNVIWKNPGNINLEGEYGYNFADNSTDISDDVGHGTHCAGIIAAELNNGKGIAGVAAKTNVKIMPIKMLDSNSSDDTVFADFASFNYVLKAKQRGVNIIATSNSWGAFFPTVSPYKEIIDKLGEEGIMTITAAGNEYADLESYSEFPALTDSDYIINVGATDESGNAAEFSNYGKASVDLFAPGVSVLSSVSYENYFPSIYDIDKRNSTTNYYGQFDADMTVTGNSVAPSTGDCGESVKGFSNLEFHVIENEDNEEDEESDDVNYDEISEGEAPTCEVSIDDNRNPTKSGESAALKLSFKNLCEDEKYYVFFPYSDNESVKGDNSRYSVTFSEGEKYCEFDTYVTAGQMNIKDDGSCNMQDKADYTGLCSYGTLISHHLSGTIYNYDYSEASTDESLEVEDSEETVESESQEAEARVTKNGIGFEIEVENEDRSDGEFVLYIDSLAVSKPNVKLSADDSYDIMSGTSMSCPAVAGAYAVLNALTPKEDGETSAERVIALKNRMYECVTRTDQLEDMCKTGGYLDLSNLDESNPVIRDAVVDLNNNLITIYGKNLSSNYKLGYRKCYKSSRITSIPELTSTNESSNGISVTYASDGKSAVINNASALFNAYTEFTIFRDEEILAENSFFLVKGENQLEKISTQEMNINSTDIQLITDKTGADLYMFAADDGYIQKYDNGKFKLIDGTGFSDVLIEYYLNKGYNKYEIYNALSYGIMHTNSPIYADNKLYQFFEISFDETDNSEKYETEYLMASIDYTADNPQWNIEKTTFMGGLSEASEEDERKFGMSVAIMDGKIYYFLRNDTNDNSIKTDVFTYDVSSKEWAKLKSYTGAGIMNAHTLVYNSKIYLMLGNEVGEDKFGEYQYTLSRIYSFDGSTWKSASGLSYIGRNASRNNFTATGNFVAVKNGIVGINCPVDGAGNTFIANPENMSYDSLNYTINSYIANMTYNSSAVETADGIYYINLEFDYD